MPASGTRRGQSRPRQARAQASAAHHHIQRVADAHHVARLVGGQRGGALRAGGLGARAAGRAGRRHGAAGPRSAAASAHTCRSGSSNGSSSGWTPAPFPPAVWPRPTSPLGAGPHLRHHAPEVVLGLAARQAADGEARRAARDELLQADGAQPRVQAALDDGEQVLLCGSRVRLDAAVDPAAGGPGGQGEVRSGVSGGVPAWWWGCLGRRLRCARGGTSPQPHSSQQPAAHRPQPHSSPPSSPHSSPPAHSQPPAGPPGGAVRGLLEARRVGGGGGHHVVQRHDDVCAQPGGVWGWWGGRAEGAVWGWGMGRCRSRVGQGSGSLGAACGGLLAAVSWGGAPGPRRARPAPSAWRRCSARSRRPAARTTCWGGRARRWGGRGGAGRARAGAGAGAGGVRGVTRHGWAAPPLEGSRPGRRPGHVVADRLDHARGHLRWAQRAS
jgi:hypothetical protein